MNDVKVIYIKTTDTCNLHCRHCFTSGRNGSKAIWDVDATANWVNDFIAKNPQSDIHLELHGGEPFLVPVPKIRSFTERFADNDRISITATTNLTYKITDEHLRFFKEVLDSKIASSWDSWIRFDSDAQVKLWKNNLQLLQSESIAIRLFVSVSSVLVNTPPQSFLDTMLELKPDEISLERLTQNGSARLNDDIFPNNERQDNWYLELYKLYKAKSWSFKILTFDSIDQKLEMNLVKVDTNCRNCEQKLTTISADGSISGCPNAGGEQTHSRITESVETYLQSNGRIREIVKELDFHKGCLYCDVFDLCGGDCHRLAWDNERCGGLKNLLRYVAKRPSNLIFKS